MIHFDLFFFIDFYTSTGWSSYAIIIYLLSLYVQVVHYVILCVGGCPETALLMYTTTQITFEYISLYELRIKNKHLK